jgi:hypothetical protein
VAQDDDTRRTWHFTELKWALQALAAPALEQCGLFPEWVVKANELALDFDHWASVMIGNYERELTEAQATGLKDIDRKLNAMTRSGADFDEGLWDDPALHSSPHWAEVRVLAARTLAAFDWPVESPPADRGGEFIR